MEKEIYTRMKKTDKVIMRGMLNRLKEHFDELTKSLYTPMPVVSFYFDIYGLINDLVVVEEISGELQKKIGRILGERWMRRKR